MSNSPTWSLYGIDEPWGERPSLFQFIRAHIRPGKAGLTHRGCKLPDVPSKGNSGLAWNLGGSNATVGHHTRVTSYAEQVADQVLRALHALTQEATEGRAATLYALLAEHKAQDYCLSLLHTIYQDPDLDWSRIYDVAIWLAEGAPDREPVKVAIAILGLYQGEDGVSTIRTLGRHEEFASYAATALDGEKNVEQNLWERVQRANGGERIRLVGKLAGTRNENIKAWMLREGYEKDAQQHQLYEHNTPYICATSGDLLGALRSPVPDDALLTGAGDILQALIDTVGWGGTEDIYEYVDAAPATELWLEHLQKRNLGVGQLAVVDRIRRFLTEDLSEKADTLSYLAYDESEKDIIIDWLVRRDDLLQRVQSIFSHPGWEDKIRKSLTSMDYPTFSAAAQSARALGVEGWDICFKRLQRREVTWSECWDLVLDTDDSGRFDRVVALARERLLLDEEMFTHSADDATLGPRCNYGLRSILQKHRVLPGKGWWLVRGSMLSSNPSTRKLAFRILASWDRRRWPGSAESVLRKVLDLEQNEEIRTLIRTLLEQQPPD